MGQTKYICGQRVTSELNCLAILVVQTRLCIQCNWVRIEGSVVCWKGHEIYRQTDLGFESWLCHLLAT